MTLRIILRGLLLACALHPLGAWAAADDTGAVSQDSGEAIARVETATTDSYERQLAAFDAASRAAPDDARLAIERCRFIVYFGDDEDLSIPRAAYDGEACTRELEQRWPADPEARLFRLDRLWGTDAAALGEGWLDEARSWPAASRRDLFVALSRAYSSMHLDGKAGEYAVRAVRLGDASLVAVAARHLAAQGDPDAAASLLRAAAPAEVSWEAAARIEAAMELPDRDAARRELRRYDRADFAIDAGTAARACLRAGDLDCARTAMGKQEKAGYESPKAIAARFDVAIATADYPAASRLIQIRDTASFGVGVQRAAVILAHAPAMLADIHVLTAVFLFAAMLLMLALLPGLLLLPVHYRGLARRLRRSQPVPAFPTLGLGSAWYGGVLALCLPMLMAALVAPESLARLLGAQDGMLPQASLLRLTLWSTLAGLVLLIPIARRLGWRALLGGREAWRSWWRVLVAWGVLILVAMVIARIHGQADTSTLQTRMVESLVDGGRQRYGTPMVLLLLAVLVPVYEELLFRGLLLGGMSRHIGFGWANLIQAVLFALAHGDSPRFVFYLALGLLTGWLVRRSKSLGPGIALHGLNNALATLVHAAAGG